MDVEGRNLVIDPPSLLLWGTAAVVCLMAAITDWRQGRIPNLLTYGAAGLGLLLHIAIPSLVESENVYHAIGWSQSLLGGAVGFGLMLAVALLSRGGGGDVKLATALGAILGPMAIVRVLGATCIGAVTGTCVIWILVGAASRRIGQLPPSRTLTPPASDPHNPAAAGEDSPAASPPPRSSPKIPLGPYFLLGVLWVAWSEMDYR